MKNIVKVYLSEKSDLFLSRSSNDVIGLLGDFLTCDVGGFPDHWVEWFNNDKYDTTSSNYCWVDKEGDNIVIGFLHSDDMEPHITISRKFLFEMLRVWKECVEGKRNELTIEEESGEFNVY